MIIAEPKKNRQFETLLPLINVVFLLLIFFMLAGSFNSPDLFKVDAPSAHSNYKADPNKIIIVVNKRGRIAINKNIVPIEKLRAVIDNEVHNASVIQIKADKNLKADILLNILDELAASHITTLRIFSVANNTL